MATTTVTASDALKGPSLIHAGVNVATCQYVSQGNTSGTGITIGDTILAVKIPNHIDIISVYGKITTGATAANATVGISGANAVFGSLASGALPVFAANGSRKYRVSLSDDAMPQETYITVSPSSGTWSVSATLDLVVQYVHP